MFFFNNKLVTSVPTLNNISIFLLMFIEKFLCANNKEGREFGLSTANNKVHYLKVIIYMIIKEHECF